MPEFKTSLTLKASPETVFAVISDFAGYSTVVPAFREAVVESRDAGQARVRFVLSLPVRNVTYRLDYDLAPPNRLSWRFVDSDTIEDNEGEWDLSPEGDGTRVSYRHRVKFPMWMAWAVTDKAFAKEMEKTLDRFKVRIDGDDPTDAMDRMIRLLD